MSRDGPVPLKAEAIAGMSAYLFHVFQLDGAALSFEVRVLASDPEAIAHAEQVLQDHRSAAEVEIWDDARLVHRAARAPAA